MLRIRPISNENDKKMGNFKIGRNLFITSMIKIDSYIIS